MHDAIGNGCEGKVVRYEHHCLARLGAGVLQQLEDGLARLVVESARGLVNCAPFLRRVNKD